MYEYQHFNGYDDVTFNIIETNCDRKTITVAISYLGKITITDYDLLENKNGLYFEYGPLFDKIYVNNFIWRNTDD